MNAIELVYSGSGVSVYRIVDADIFRSNTYILVHRDAVVVVDPCILSNDVLLEALRLTSEANAASVYVLNTHGHLDHICSNTVFRRELNAKIVIHELDSYLLSTLDEHLAISAVVPEYSADRFRFQRHRPDVMVRDCDVISVSDLKIKVVHTPGHTRGSTTFYVENHGLAFTGDFLMRCSVGRTDLPHSDVSSIAKSLDKILKILPPETLVLPGHGPKFVLRDEVRCIEEIIEYLRSQIQLS